MKEWLKYNSQLPFYELQDKFIIQILITYISCIMIIENYLPALFSMLLHANKICS